MSNSQVMIFFFSLLFSVSVKAENWRAVLERAGFMGTVALGASYEWTPQQATDLTIGAYPIGSETYYQANLIYRYSHWSTDVGENVWQPFQVGFFMVYALNDQKYFFTSPSKYPYSDYYDQTALRYGLAIGTTYTFVPNRFAIAYRMRLFDTGLIAIFNNSERNLQYYVSSGISFQYLF